MLTSPAFESKFWRDHAGASVGRPREVSPWPSATSTPSLLRTLRLGSDDQPVARAVEPRPA